MEKDEEKELEELKADLNSEEISLSSEDLKKILEKIKEEKQES